MMFHIKYPRFRGFYSWDELGCLARALGFPKDLFKNNLSDEIEHEDNGISDKELLRMLDYKMLDKSLHLSLNNHTADWNCCVIRRALAILDKQGLTFEDLYNARLAYQAYEASDMKGMELEQHRIIRTLKMCGKTISPMKLMHRVKHSKDSFEEAGRMQLYEFLDLILWANDYEPYIPQKPYGHFEMEDEMFKLLDFDHLLSHHDQRLANRLDRQYLEEEWTFSKEKLGDRSKFKEPPVACSDSRVEMAREQKKTYQGLKNEVVSSQKMVYFSQQGLVRPRPLTAPNLTMYQQMDEETKRKQSIAAHNALYHKYQKILDKARNKGKGAKFEVDLSDKPVLEESVRCETPRIVSADDLRETREEFQNLMFNKETEKARYEIKMDTEMDHYIPEFKEKWLEKKEKAINPKEMVRRKAWEEKLYKYKNRWTQLPIETVKDDKAGRYDDGDIINHLTYPINRLPPSHAKKCDARFRGWYETKSRQGSHFILVSPYFHNSPKGRLLNKLAKMSDDEINKLHGQFLFRYTRKNQVDDRPVTAPAVLSKVKAASLKSPSSGYHSMDDKSSRTTPKAKANVGKIDKQRKGTRSPEIASIKDKETLECVSGKNTDNILEEIKIKLKKLEGKSINDVEDCKEEQDEEPKLIKEDCEEDKTNGDDNAQDVQIPKSSNIDKADENVISRQGSTLSGHSADTSVSETIRKVADDKPKTKIRSKSAYVKRYDKLQNSLDSVYIADECRKPRAKSAVDRGNLVNDIVDIVPIPYMDHSKPKVVSVGSIGKVSVLESISESKYWEDVLLEELAKRQAEERGELSDSSSDSAYSDVDSVENFENLRNPSVKKRTKSNTDMDSGSAILALILDEEKARRKRAKSHSSRYSGNISPKSPLTKSPRSNRSASSASSGSRSLKSPAPEKKSPAAIIDIKLTENIKESEQTANNETTTYVDRDAKKEPTNREISSDLIVHDKRVVKPDRNDTKVKSDMKSIIRKQDSHANKLNFRSNQNHTNMNEYLKTDNLPQKHKKVMIVNTDPNKTDSALKKPVKKFERLVSRMDGSISRRLSTRLMSVS